MTTRILVADDDRDFHLVIRVAFEESGFNGLLHFVTNGIKLMEFLQQKSNTPDLILLDLKMPYKDGREALSEIKADSRLRSIPIFIFSSSTAEADLQLARDNSCFFVQKPQNYSEWRKAAEDILHFLGNSKSN
jgi:CheY-like chemotaxis protein